VQTQLQAELDTELEKFNGSNEKIKALEKKYNQAVAEIEVSQAPIIMIFPYSALTILKEVEKETQAILREKSRTDKEKVKSQEKEKFLAQKQKKLQKTISQSKLQASEANAMIERSGQDRERCDGEVAEKKEELAGEEENLETILGSLKEKTQVFSDEIAGKQKILEPYKEKINEKQSAIAVAQSELDMISQRENSSRQALEEAQAKIGQIEESRNEKEIELEECRKEKAVLQKKAQKLQAKIQEEAKKEPQLKDKLSGARSKADEARSAMAENQSQGLVLTTLLRLSESGRIDGFHGRLGGLATIDDKYQIAISAACPQLENMVVETKDIGDQCVAHLRKNNSGRASFMMLDSIQKRNMNHIDTPEGAPRLFDLLKLKDSKFAPAFYQVLHDTLVAESTEQAKRLAYGQKKRWRVVTLQGTLFESAGSMTGGGKSRPPVRMSSKLPAQISKAAIQELEQTRDQLEAAYNEFLNQQRQLQSELRDVQERIPELDVTMSKIELEIKASAQHMVDAKRRIDETKKEMGASTTDKSRVAALQKTIKSLEKEIEKLQAETADVEEEIRALNDKISQAGGAALRGSKATVALIKEQLDTLNEEISKADLNRSKAEKQLKKAEKTLKTAEEEFAANEIELKGLQEDIKELEKEASEKQGQAEEAEAVSPMHYLIPNDILTCDTVP
jgi:structural maintenance of chromosome 4